VEFTKGSNDGSKEGEAVETTVGCTVRITVGYNDGSSPGTTDRPLDDIVGTGDEDKNTVGSIVNTTVLESDAGNEDGLNDGYEDGLKNGSDDINGEVLGITELKEYENSKKNFDCEVLGPADGEDTEEGINEGKTVGSRVGKVPGTIDG
jgi:hypothetical protein